MNARFFIDTNILVYAFSGQDPVKKSRAMSLLRSALEEGAGIISWQVVQEFLHLALHKNSLQIDSGTLVDTLHLILTPLCQVFATANLWDDALRLQRQFQYRFYDSLIIAAAVSSGVNLLYSEDLQHGQMIGSLRIENPFVA